MSQLGGPLVRGVDCPADAEHLDGIATFHLLATPDGLVSDVARARGMATACLFESDAGGSTLWRHTTSPKAVDACATRGSCAPRHDRRQLRSSPSSASASTAR